MKKITKGVKITATKENIPYILPTLIKLGGINHDNLVTYENEKRDGIVEGEIYFINDDGIIDYTTFSDIPKLEKHYEELDPSNYINEIDKTTINKSLTEQIKECINNIDEYVTDILLNKNKIREIESRIEILYAKIHEANKVIERLEQELENQSNK
jgi:predicted RNase H-like nuclease (RuvC/YqgF family)